MTRTVKSTRVGRPRAGEGSDIEPRILARTWELFVNGGYSAITYEALSRLERMSKQTIYSRFENKETLFRAAAERKITAWIEETGRATEAASADPVAAAITETFRVMMYPDSAALVRLLRSNDVGDAQLRALLHSRNRDAVDRLTDRIVASRPKMSRDEAHVCASSIFSMLYGHASINVIDLSGARRTEHFDYWAPRMVTMATRMLAFDPPMPN